MTTPGQQNSVLRFRNVSVAYGSLLALEDVSLDVLQGEFLCIVGANGSGKSTLLRAALGLIPLSGGSIQLALSRGQTAYVPQLEQADPNFPATVREIVLTGAQRKGHGIPFYSRRDKRGAQETMESLNIAHLADVQIGRLSGGQRQRVLLARALCRSPELLFLDEPCSGLDSETRFGFYKNLASLHRARRTTIVMVSHDLREVATCADRVAVLARRLVFSGPVADWRARFPKDAEGKREGG
ncbi:MAG: ABC transporter ATP-binding protein [Fretibacterium sp.]|nr:ABC transporter ATP-binding protein [Fretibacterium sp.]